MAVAGVAMAGTGAVVAQAAPPAFPNNIVVFPDRDFVTIEGYQDHVGETATVTVTRGTQVVGSAKGVVQEGDVAFEINHPGGYCWGAGTGLNVTPDIRAGDKVGISFDNGGAAGDTTLLDAAVDGKAQLVTPTRVVVVSHIAANVNPSQIEQRIINPDLKDTNVGRRDVRATPDGTGDAGYTSSLVVEGTKVTATYDFTSATAASIAANGGGERMMAWQVEDADANRQGLTISEFGEIGGPGMGGCPAGPADQGAPAAGQAYAIMSADKQSVQVQWTPAAEIPDGQPVTGYQIQAIDNAADSLGQKATLGLRTGASATKATVSGLDPAKTYTVEVRSIAGAEMSAGFPVTIKAGGGTERDTTVPTLKASPAPTPGGVTEATSVELSSDSGTIYYTTNGEPAVSAGMPTDAAKPYAGPIAIAAANTELRAVSFDDAGNYETLFGTYSPTPAVAPGAPTGLRATAGPLSIALSWGEPDPSVTGYGVQVYEADGTTPVGPLRETTERNMTVNELTADANYHVSVKARNSAGYGAEAKVGPVKALPVTDNVTIASARYRAGREFRVSGTTSRHQARIQVYRLNADNSLTAITGATVLTTPAVAPATGGVYEVRMRDGATPPTTAINAGQRIVVRTTDGTSQGQSAPFTVAQG